MQTHGNLTASYLWQPGEFARRMLGERPSPVPPTRELWPPTSPLSISTLHVAYLQEEPPPRRASTLPPRQFLRTPTPQDRYQDIPQDIPRFCTIGTNTDPPPTILSRIRNLFKSDTKNEKPPQPAGRLTAVTEAIEQTSDGDENVARRAFSGIKRAISGAKHRIAPGSGTVDSPKIVYDVPKPGDRMTTAFGSRSGPRRWLPSNVSCARRLRSLGTSCVPTRRPPPRRQPRTARLQITQV